MPANRDTAASRKHSPTGGTAAAIAAIKALFRAAKALLCPQAAPQPQARRRRGDTDTGTVAPLRTMRHRLAKTPPAARGRYAALQPAQEPIAPIVDVYAAATVSTATTLDWLMNLWDANSGMEDSGGLDDSFDTKQNHYYPQP